MPSQEERDQIIEFCEFCQHPQPYHSDGPTGACRADGTDSLRCKCLSFQRGKMSEETKTIEELLPCPFCGGQAERCRTDPDIDEYFIECSGCEASSGSMYGSTTEASKAWNTRSNTAERERREAAENLLEEFREDAQANIDRQSDCSDPDRECLKKDQWEAYKAWQFLCGGALESQSESVCKKCGGTEDQHNHAGRPLCIFEGKE